MKTTKIVGTKSQALVKSETLGGASVIAAFTVLWVVERL
jgi:hypothetical protein